MYYLPGLMRCKNIKKRGLKYQQLFFTANINQGKIVNEREKSKILYEAHSPIIELAL